MKKDRWAGCTDRQSCFLTVRHQKHNWIKWIWQSTDRRWACVWVCVCISQLLSLYFTQLCHSVIPLHLLLGITLPNPSIYSLSSIQATLIAGCEKSCSIYPSPFTLVPRWIPPSHLLHPPLHLSWDLSVSPFLYHIVYPADYSIMAHFASLLSFF